MRTGILALVLVLVAAACGDRDADTTEPSQFPTGSVRSWFDALAVNDSAAALELTHQESMLVVLAAENDMEIPQVAALLRRGATAESAARYLADFTIALRSRYGGNLAEVAVDGFAQITDTYAAVTVTGEGPATIITRRAPGGLWQVDFVGTLGPALITQIRELLEGAGEGEDATTLRDSFETGVIPALEAAAVHDPENLTLASEIRAIKALLGSID